jgi:transcriptional regulator with XRE-family HTH domain
MECPGGTMLRVKHERLLRGWTQTVLAYHAGMSAAEISRIESGRLRPYPGQVERLSVALGVPAKALLEEAAEPGRATA